MRMGEAAGVVALAFASACTAAERSDSSVKGEVDVTARKAPDSSVKKELDRATALGILKENAAKPGVLPQPYLYSVGDLSMGVLYEDKGFSLDLTKQPWPRAWAIGRLAWLQALTKAGFLSGPSVKEAQVRGQYLFSGSTAPVTFYEFRVNAREDVRKEEDLTPSGQRLGEKAVFVLTTVALSRVTGIRQQGSEAIVDAEVTIRPTPAYEALARAVEEIRGTTDWPTAPLGSADQQFPLGWPKTGAVKNITHTFVLYDDGWRLTL